MTRLNAILPDGRTARSAACARKWLYFGGSVDRETDLRAPTYGLLGKPWPSPLKRQASSPTPPLLGGVAYDEDQEVVIALKAIRLAREADERNGQPWSDK